MNAFFILLLISLALCALGFYKFLYFISVSYGFSVAAMGAALLLMFRSQLDAASGMLCALLIIQGLRLGGYLLYRDLRGTVKRDEVDRPLSARAGLWVSCALMYTCEVSPVLFRLQNGVKGGVMAWVGIGVMLCGILLEAAADLQKSRAKKKNPRRFVDTGLYRWVRCPNYFGEMLTWTGVFLSGLGALRGVWQWVAAVFGFACIVYIMFGGTRRLELQQNARYGDDPEYRAYVKKTPVLLPFVPLYSVAKYEWLRA